MLNTCSVLCCCTPCDATDEPVSARPFLSAAMSDDDDVGAPATEATPLLLSRPPASTLEVSMDGGDEGPQSHKRSTGSIWREILKPMIVMVGDTAAPPAARRI
jgi:hypothetical protein